MADVLGTVMTVLDIVNRAIEIYQKIEKCPDQMRRIGRRMARLRVMLQRVESFLAKHPINKLGTDVLLSIIEDIREDSKEVESLFLKYNDTGKLGHAWFAMTSNVEEIIALGDEIEKNRGELYDELQIMGKEFGLDHAEPVIDSGNGQATQDHNQPGKAQAGPPGKEPSVRADYKILFVDPYNVSRSVVAEAYIQLVRGWTVGTGGHWSIQVAHSAGFFVRHRSNTLNDIEHMKYMYPSYKLTLKDGNKSPEQPALAALFNNHLFKYPFKQKVRHEVEARHSRGLLRTMFKDYHYIIAFTDREYDNLVGLRNALIAKDGKKIATSRGKGRVLLLGSFLPHSGKPREILAAKDLSEVGCDGMVSDIKKAVKGFLTQELGWEQPKKGASLVKQV